MAKKDKADAVPKAAHEAAHLMPEQAPPRLRSINDIDLGRAKKGCKNCHGRGISGWKNMDDPTEAGKKLRVGVVCHCVTRRGGVRPDSLQQLAQRIQDRIAKAPGDWGRRLAADLQGMPVDYREQARENLRVRAQAADVPDVIKAELGVAIATLDADPDFLTRPALPPKPSVMPEAPSPAEGD